MRRLRQYLSFRGDWTHRPGERSNPSQEAQRTGGRDQARIDQLLSITAGRRSRMDLHRLSGDLRLGELLHFVSSDWRCSWTPTYCGARLAALCADICSKSSAGADRGKMRRKHRPPSLCGRSDGEVSPPLALVSCAGRSEVRESVFDLLRIFGGSLPPLPLPPDVVSPTWPTLTGKGSSDTRGGSIPLHQ